MINNKNVSAKFRVIGLFGLLNLRVIGLFAVLNFAEDFLSLNLRQIIVSMERIFKRKIYDRLLRWKDERRGKTAVLIEGARRVGKSTIAEQFARAEYESYILIDFNKASKSIHELFEDLNDLDFIFLQLQATYNTVLKPRKSVIIFDKVQKCPKARQAIKYLVKDGRYDYIETGSLISIKKNTKDITIPSEEERVSMHPMDFEEFRWAMDDEVTMPLLRQFYENKLPLGAAHRTKMRDLRLYMLVGGMPQAVNEYLDTNNLSMVDLVKRDIIRLYLDDFQKIDTTGRVEKLFLHIPSQLSQTNNRYKTNQVLGEVNDLKLLELIGNLEDSRTVNLAYHSNDPNVGMPMSQDGSKYKIYCADTGLFVTLAFWDKAYTDNVIYDKLLIDKLPANLGYIYENLVAQMLTASGNKLFYYTWMNDDKHSYEVDFLLSRGAKIQPVEVKSSGYKSHSSLDKFSEKFSNYIGARYLIYTKDFQNDEQTTLMPVYMTPLL